MKINNITENQIKNKMLKMGLSIKNIKYNHYQTKDAIKKVIKDKIINKIKEILPKIENVNKNTEEIKNLIKYIKTIFNVLLVRNNTKINNQKNTQDKINKLYDKYTSPIITMLKSLLGL